MRAVIDTNVIVSGVIRPLGAPGEILRAIRDRRLVPLLSPPIFEEIVDVLSRPWLSAEYDVDDATVTAFLRLLLVRAELIEPQSEIHRCRDPRDDKFLAAAVDGRADRIVSGDADLLVLGSIEGIAIVDPATFVDELE